MDIEKLKNTKIYKLVSIEEANYLYTNYPWIKSIKEGIFCLKENIISEPICTLQICDNPKYFNPSGKTGYTKGCCKSCTIKISMLEKYGVENISQLQSIKDKVKNTIQEKYGCDNVFQMGEVKEKSKLTNLKKYGVEYPTQNKVIREKCIITTIMNYGVKSPLQNSEILSKTQETNMKKYGVENVSSVSEFRRKAEDTMLERYGSHSSKSETVKNKVKINNLEKYGVEHPFQDSKVYEKAFKKSCKYKTFKWNDGNISKVQGHEPIVLKELEESGYGFNDILTSTNDMPEIWYEFEGSEHRYYPDFYIPSENLIIEVKSEYTLQKQLDKNQAKFEAVKKLGFNFRLEVR